ncbi:hypothetical protein [Chromobacterium haemolyticum]|uniref:hypothetical protein n=1 Tax=Chromobacterium haemolyticum TaxID=394935 RepID=UPI0009D981E4|nr:hypothetical protein [Chromobacterium haemolyticum]OQS40594.1 hypothetical protein B0T39_11250 [Chromobacterium haemolyticum]
MSLNNGTARQGHKLLDLPETAFAGFPPAEMQQAGELAAIRYELAALREALQPPRSIIITGSEVERVLAAMKGGEA